MSVNKGGQGGSTHMSLSLSVVIFFASSSDIHCHCGCLSSLGSSVITATLHHHCPPVSIVVVWPLWCVVINAKGGRGWGGDMAVGECYVGCPCAIDTAGAHCHCGWCVYMSQGQCDGHVGVVLSLQHMRQRLMSLHETVVDVIWPMVGTMWVMVMGRESLCLYLVMSFVWLWVPVKTS